MHILFVSGWFPYPPDNGARMRTYYLLRELTKHHSVDLLAFARDGRGEPRGVEALRPVCRILGTIPFRSFRPLGRKALLGLFSPEPRSLRETYSPQMQEEVDRALQRGGYDLVMTSEIGPGTYTSRYAVGRAVIPQVVEDLELSMIRNKVEAQPTPWGRMRHRLTWWKLQRYIAGFLPRVAGCTVASEMERKVLKEVVPHCGQVAVIPNGVDLKWYDGDFGPPEPDTLVFNGALTYEANYEAMKFFLGKVFPRIREARPGVTLRITGRTDGVDLEGLPLGEGVTLTGYVEDIRPVVARSAVCVAPLTTGGGTRLKILEAMALDTPVVSTSKGAEGLEVTSGHNILIADEPTAFANAVLRLLGDAHLRASLSRNARKLVEERYDWRRIGEELDRFLCQIVRDAESRGVG